MPIKCHTPSSHEQLCMGYMVKICYHLEYPMPDNQLCKMAMFGLHLSCLLSYSSVVTCTASLSIHSMAPTPVSVLSLVALLGLYLPLLDMGGALLKMAKNIFSPIITKSGFEDIGLIRMYAKFEIKWLEGGFFFCKNQNFGLFMRITNWGELTQNFSKSKYSYTCTGLQIYLIISKKVTLKFGLVKSIKHCHLLPYWLGQFVSICLRLLGFMGNLTLLGQQFRNGLGINSVPKGCY